MINILIVDDDINKISKIIDSANSNINAKIAFTQATNVLEALEILKTNHFQLMITDLLMPLRKDEPSIKTAGSVLINEIYKGKNKSNIPLYIVGLTSYVEHMPNFSKIWPMWIYKADDIEWEYQLRDILFHITKIEEKIIREKQETIFVEGESDKRILTHAFKLFHPQELNKVSIETIKYGGGSSWVERQLVIWAKTLLHGADDNYLQAVGLFDNDSAGHKAIQEVDAQIPVDTAGRSTFSVIKLDQKYARHLIPIYKGGVILPITLEEMYCPKTWKDAESNGWLIQRKLSEDLLTDPKMWDRTNQSLTEYTASLSLTNECLFYIQKKVNDDFKEKLVNHVLALPEQEQKQRLIAFDLLIKDLVKRLNIGIK